jgi:hypothetical protein
MYAAHWSLLLCAAHLFRMHRVDDALCRQGCCV